MRNSGGNLNGSQAALHRHIGRRNPPGRRLSGRRPRHRRKVCRRNNRLAEYLAESRELANIGIDTDPSHECEEDYRQRSQNFLPYPCAANAGCGDEDAGHRRDEPEARWKAEGHPEGVPDVADKPGDQPAQDGPDNAAHGRHEPTPGRTGRDEHNQGYRAEEIHDERKGAVNQAKVPQPIEHQVISPFRATVTHSLSGIARFRVRPILPFLKKTAEISHRIPSRQNEPDGCSC